MTTWNCNKPRTTIDARGAVTTYDWNANGGIAWVRGPSIGGVQIETRYYYANAAARYYGAILTSPTALNDSPDVVNVLASTRSCRTGNWGCAASNETRTTVAYYGGGGAATNLNVLSRTSGSGDGVLASTTSYEYNSYGDVTKLTDPNGNATRSVYNANRQVTWVVGPDPDGSGAKRNRTVYTAYRDDGFPSVVQVGTSLPDASAFTVLQTVTPVYDSYGRKVAETLNAGFNVSQTRYSFDAFGRLECVSVRMTPSTFGDPPSSACTQSSGGQDRITKTLYTNTGLVASVYDGVGIASINSGVGRRVVLNSYSDNRKLTQLTDANGNPTAYVYDGQDRLYRTCYNSTHSACAGSTPTADREEALAFDNNGNVTSRRLRDGTQIGYSYDALNRLTSKVLPGTESSVSYTYDNIGNMLTAAQMGSTVTNTYDPLSRLKTAQQPYGTIDYAYDLGGRRTQIGWTGTGLTASYCYDAAGGMTAVREGGTGCAGGTLLASYDYDALGNRTSITRANGVSTTLSYDAASRLSQIVQDLTGTTEDQTIGITAYNPADQILTRTSSNNRYAWTQHLNASRTYTADALNRYSTIASTIGATISPTYDGRGNLTSGGSIIYAYTSENMLKSSSDGTALNYDSLNRLTQLTKSGYTTRFVYDGGEISMELDGSGTVLKRYVTGAGLDEPLVWYEGTGLTDKRWLIADERGSIIAVTNSVGNSLRINTYDTYGIPGPNNLGRFQYTGQSYLAELGVYYYKARMYSPTLGRFLQTDPIGYADGPNLYNYVRSDPVNWRDPSGLRTDLAAFGAYYSHGTDINPKDPGAFVGKIYDGLDLSIVIGDPRWGPSVGGSGIFADNVGGGYGGYEGQQQNGEGEDIVVTVQLRTYRTVGAAAAAAIEFYNPISIATNTELTGTIYRVPFSGYTFSRPVKSGPAGGSNAPTCIICSAFYHTHAAFDPRFDNESFSSADRAYARLYGVPIYLGTPGGAFKMYNPITGYEGPGR